MFWSGGQGTFSGLLLEGEGLLRLSHSRQKGRVGTALVRLLPKESCLKESCLHTILLGSAL